MRLLFLSQDFPPEIGGVETYAVELARRLAPRFDFFGVVAPNQRGAREVDATLPFPVYRLPRGVGIRPDALGLVALPYLPALARRHRIDVAFHAQWQMSLTSLLARRLTGYPRKIAVAAHGRELLLHPFYFDPLDRLYDRLRRLALGAADALLPVSRYTADLLVARGADRRRIQVIPNGTEPERFYPQDATAQRRALGVEDRKVLLTVARLVGRKGIDTVLRALPRVAADVPDVVYLIVGDGPDRGRLEHLAAEVGVAGRVRFLGRVPYAEVPALFNTCDVFVMPSRNAEPDVEGFGIVFLEANACGKPVVGARAGGIPDAIIHGETGLLTTPGDPADLARALLCLLRHPETAQRLGAQGRQRVLERGTWDHSAARLGDALDTLGRDL